MKTICVIDGQGGGIGATGENPVTHTVTDVDLVLGLVAIAWPNAMMGEVSPHMAATITSCRAPKILIPMHQEKIILVGASREPLPHLVDALLDQYVEEHLKDV